VKTLTVIFLLTACMSASATWEVKQGRFDQDYYVMNGHDNRPGTTKIKAGSEKDAKKLAKKLNKAEKKDKKGVYDDGSEHCDNPLVNC